MSNKYAFSSLPKCLHSLSQVSVRRRGRRGRRATSSPPKWTSLLGCLRFSLEILSQFQAGVVSLLDHHCRQVGLSSSLFPSPYLSLPGSVLLPPLKPCSANYFPFPSDGWCGRFDHGLLHHSSTSSLLKRTSWRLGGPLYVLESKILLNQISNRAKRFQTLIGMLCNKTEKLGGITKEGCIFLASLTPQEVTWK